MSNRVDLYDSTYGNFKEQVLAEVRRETYGEDIGQNSWITAEEYDAFYGWLSLLPTACARSGERLWRPGPLSGTQPWMPHYGH